MTEHMQTEGDPSPIVAPMPKPAGEVEEMEADAQHRRLEQPDEGPDFEEETEQFDNKSWRFDEDLEEDGLA